MAAPNFKRCWQVETVSQRREREVFTEQPIRLCHRHSGLLSLSDETKIDFSCSDLPLEVWESGDCERGATLIRR